MRYLIAFIIAAVLVLGSSCSAQKEVRKCDGNKGVKTNMGVM